MQQRQRVAFTAFLATLTAGGLNEARSILAQAPAQSLSFSSAQAERGADAYAEHCASCHGPNLDDGAFAPALAGVDFRLRWGSASPLFAAMSEKMPPARPGSLDQKTYADLLAYILQENGLRPGERELPADADALSTLAVLAW